MPITSLKLPTGELYAGEPPVQFGGRGEKSSLPLFLNSTSNIKAFVKLNTVKTNEQLLQGIVSFEHPNEKLTTIQPGCGEQNSHKFIFLLIKVL